MMALCLLLSTSGIALADDAALLRCRAITDAAARLACYDAIVPLPTDSKAAQATVGQPEKFGLEARTEADVIESSIEGRFLGWQPKANITLANGQIWQITDDSSGSYSLNNPKVSVRRGMFGVFFLEIEGVNRTPKVRRLR